MENQTPRRDIESRDFSTVSEREEFERATGEIRNRLRTRGVKLFGNESSLDLATLLDAVERFEIAVQAKGGDLMVDEGPAGKTREPDDPHFVLPNRRDDESLASYLARIDESTDVVRHHGARMR